MILSLDIIRGVILIVVPLYIQKPIQIIQTVTNINIGILYHIPIISENIKTGDITQIE
jgi:hypothetical protein